MRKLAEERYRLPGSPKGNLTFREFVLLMIDNSSIAFSDKHWRPVYDSCLPCRVPYDFIGHYETLQEDAKYVLEKVGLGNYTLPHYHNSSASSKGIVAREFATLSHREIEKLTSIYRLDFLLYGYSNELRPFTSEIT